VRPAPTDQALDDAVLLAIQKVSQWLTGRGVYTDEVRHELRFPMSRKRLGESLRRLHDAGHIREGHEASR
jgi:hypothetical protein